MGIKDGYVALRMPGETPYPDHSEFLTPSRENTLTWGDSQNLTFLPESAEGNAFPSIQLVHVRRRRPTTFTVAIVVSLGGGWTGETNLTVLITYIIGVGQTMCQFQKSITITNPTDNTQVINDVQQLPATALQVQVTPSVFNLLNVGKEHGIQVTALAAPVYA